MTLISFYGLEDRPTKRETREICAFRTLEIQSIQMVTFPSFPFPKLPVRKLSGPLSSCFFSISANSRFFFLMDGGWESNYNIQGDQENVPPSRTEKRKFSRKTEYSIFKYNLFKYYLEKFMTCNKFFMSERGNLENSIFLILTDFNDFGILSNVNLIVSSCLSR